MTPRATSGHTRPPTLIWSRTDWSLLIGGLGLSLVGALLVWSATRHQSGSGYLARHLLNTGIGLALAAAVTRVDFRGLRAYAPWLYLASVDGLLLVLTPGRLHHQRLALVDPAARCVLHPALGVRQGGSVRRPGGDPRRARGAESAALTPGFLGSAGLLLILGFLVLRTLMIAVRTWDTFSRLVAVGVACWFVVQICENVGMNLGMTQVTGLPLPFVSYGGSSMFACWLALGLVNNAHLSDLRRL